MTRLIQIEKQTKSLKWHNLEQGIANRYIKKNNFRNIKSLNISIFMDGKNFFDKINFQYNRSANYLNLIGFHNDFTIGNIAKMYRIKELGLYQLDDDGYYSSKIRKYLYYSNNNIIADREKVTYLLSTLIYISKILKRIFIFPRFSCGKTTCTFVRLYNLEYYEGKCGRDYRENSFIFSSLIPENIIKDSKRVINITNKRDIYNLINNTEQLIIVENIGYINKKYVNCFRYDDYKQRKYKL